MEIPLSFTAGDTLSWEEAVADYPAGQGYTLHYALLKTGARIVMDSAASGDNHKFSISAATSAAYAAGSYDWTAYITKSTTERYTVGNGRLGILPNLSAQSTGFDNRSQSRQILETLLSEYQKAVTNKAFVFEYQIAGRLMRFMKKEEWIAEIQFWQAQVAAEDRQAAITNGQSPVNRLLVRF